MKANRFAMDADTGVSNVVGAILFFALVVTLLVVVRTTWVPAWTSEQESAHMSLVQEQFAGLKSQADKQVSNRSNSPVAEPLTLYQQRSSFFESPSLPGTLEVQPTGASVNVSTNELTVFSAHSSRVSFGASENWQEHVDVVESVGLVQHLRIRVLDPESESEGDSVTLRINDAEGAFAGSITVYIDRHPSGYSVKTHVINDTSVTLYNQGESLFQQDQPAMYWINALADELQFRDVLNAAQAPLTLTMTEHGMQGEYAIDFLEDDGSGVLFLGGTGARTLAPYGESFDGGRLVYQGRSSEFPQQRIIFENGAVILEQEEGAVFLYEPTMAVHATGARTLLDMTVPLVGGEGDASSKRGTISLGVQAVQDSGYSATAPRYTYAVTTDHPDLWASFWRIAFGDAGLQESAGHFTVSSGPGAASFTLYGPTTDPASTVHDLNVIFRQALVEMDLGT